MILRITLAIHMHIVVHALPHGVCKWRAHTGTPVTGACLSKGQTESEVKGHTQIHRNTHTYTELTQADSPGCIPGRISWLGFLVAFSLCPNVLSCLFSPTMTAVNSLNARNFRVNDMVGWYCRWVAGILLHLHSFIPPSSLVLTPAFIKILWNVLCHGVGGSVERALVRIALSMYYLLWALEPKIAVYSSSIYHQLIGIHSCFLPSSLSSLTLCCVKIPPDRKQVETNYNV